MFFIDIANPGYTLAFLLLTVCVILLGKETKKSAIPAVLLIGFLVLLVMHLYQYMNLAEEYYYMANEISRCLTYDFIFIFLAYISYLWIDDIESKFKKKKSIDNSLDWFWKKV